MVNQTLANSALKIPPSYMFRVHTFCMLSFQEMYVCYNNGEW